MSWLRSHIHKGKGPAQPTGDAPPAWTPAPETSHTWGLHNEATTDEYEAAEAFCARFPREAPRLLPSDTVDRIKSDGCLLWTLDAPHSRRFVGQITEGGKKNRAGVTHVLTGKKCGDVCILSNLPIIADWYIRNGAGVYYEVTIKRMDGIVAIGTACRPYPDWRFPGWNRESVGLHLDDMRKFYQDASGGCDYDPILSSFSCGDVIGCGYDFLTSGVFYTYNGHRLPDAFRGIYVPTQSDKYDVYAAIGVEGACEFEVNFGADLFKWKPGNEWQWRVEGSVGQLSGSSGRYSDGLPTYEELGKAV